MSREKLFEIARKSS